MFGDLTRQPNDDSDGDGYSNKREGELGQDALVPDEVEGGYRWTTFHRIRLRRHHHGLGYRKKRPSGFVTESSNFLEQNSSLSTINLHGAVNGYHFAYWTVNGVRQAAPTGIASSHGA